MVYSYPAFPVILHIYLFCSTWFFETDICIYKYCVYICISISVFVFVEVHIQADQIGCEAPASASQGLNYRRGSTKSSYSRGFKQMHELTCSLTSVFQISSPKTEANTTDRGREESHLWRVLRTWGAHRLKHETSGREIPFPWEINKLNQMEINLIFSFSPYYPNWFNLWQLLRHSYNEKQLMVPWRLRE